MLLLLVPESQTLRTGGRLVLKKKWFGNISLAVRFIPFRSSPEAVPWTDF